MDILVMIGMLFFSYIAFYMFESRASHMIWGVVVLILGIFTVTEGITLNGVYLTTVNTVQNFTFGIILLFGGLYNMYNSILERKKK